jgi:hypothetical protein
MSPLLENWWGKWEADCWRFLDWPDDGYGNCLNPVGSWYHEHPEEPLPSEWHIRANGHGAKCFVFGH